MTESRWQRAKADRATLALAYPRLFDLDAPRPLAIGIDRELVAALPGRSRTEIRFLLNWWTSRRAYLAACTPDAARWSLTGPVGYVSTQAAESAQRRFLARNERSRPDDRWTQREDGRWEAPRAVAA